MIERPEALARVVAAISASHQVLDHQADVDQADSVVWGQVPLSGKNETNRPKRQRDLLGILVQVLCNYFRVKKNN